MHPKPKNGVPVRAPLGSKNFENFFFSKNIFFSCFSYLKVFYDWNEQNKPEFLVISWFRGWLFTVCQILVLVVPSIYLNIWIFLWIIYGALAWTNNFKRWTNIFNRWACQGNMIHMTDIAFYKVTRPSEANDASFSDFFIFHFFTTFSFFHSPRRCFLLAPPSSLFLFLPCPALSQLLRIHKRPFFIEFDESVTNQRTNEPTEGQGLI